MRRAFILFRPNRHYRADEFGRGIRRHGYEVITGQPSRAQPGDLLLVWNRNRATDPVATKFERQGGRVVVAENGYLNRVDGEKTYALALDQHNGAGRWFVGDEARFEVPMRDFRPDDGTGTYLVLPQRGIGAPGVAMPLDWPKTVIPRLRKLAPRRRFVLRRHPGVNPLAEPLDLALARASAVVTWGSGAAIKAILDGLPCFHDFARWIGAPASTPLAQGFGECHEGDRKELWRRVSWAQWTMAEIESGEAFDRLIHEADNRLLCAGAPPLDQHRKSDGPRDSRGGRQG